MRSSVVPEALRGSPPAHYGGPATRLHCRPFSSLGRRAIAPACSSDGVSAPSRKSMPAPRVANREDRVAIASPRDPPRRRGHLAPIHPHHSRFEKRREGVCRNGVMAADPAGLATMQPACLDPPRHGPLRYAAVVRDQLRSERARTVLNVEHIGKAEAHRAVATGNPKRAGNILSHLADRVRPRQVGLAARPPRQTRPDGWAGASRGA
jgi:hypothetical protein